MKSKFISFLIWLSSLTVFLWLVIHYLFPSGGIPLPQPATDQTLFFFAFLTVISFLLTAYSYGKDRFTFVNIAYLVMALRMFGTIIFILLFLWHQRPYSKSFLLLMFGLYIFYTVFEIYYLTTKLHPDFNKDKPSNE